MRRRAEGHAANTAADRPDTLSPEEARQTLHELRVHQIELEMQNEDLRRTQGELEASRVRYFDLYDLAPVGYCTLSEQGLILEANLTAATLLGVAQDVLVTQPITRFILKEDQGIYYRLRKQLFETHSASSGQAHSASSGQAHSASSGQAHSASSGQAHSALRLGSECVKISVNQRQEHFSLMENQKVTLGFSVRRRFLHTLSVQASSGQASSLRQSSVQAGQAGEPQACELRMVKKDGTTFWAHLEATAAPALSPSNGQDPSTGSILRRGSVMGDVGAENNLRTWPDRGRRLPLAAFHGIQWRTRRCGKQLSEEPGRGRIVLTTALSGPPPSRREAKG
jgi:hypothetical protein